MRYGFIRTKEEIKFLILYCMKHLTFAVTYNTIVDLCTWCDDGFGYFELTDAFNELTASCHIENVEDDLYSITEKGISTADIFADNLPFTAREAAQKSALRVMRQIRRDADIKTAFISDDSADCRTELCMENVFSLSMVVVDKEQSAMLERNFKRHAEKIYSAILKAVIHDYDNEE